MGNSDASIGADRTAVGDWLAVGFFLTAFGRLLMAAGPPRWSFT